MWSQEKAKFYKKNPHAWLKENFDIPIIHPWQNEFFQDLPNHNYFALKSGNGVGKTTTLALTVLWLMSTHPMCRIQCTAPSESQLFQGLWAEIALWLERSYLLKQSIIWTQTKIMMRGYEALWWAYARTAQAKPGSQASESLQGTHSENNMAIVDEASGVEDSATAAMLGMLATGKSKLIMAGNPIRKSGLFYDAFHKLQHIFRCYTIASNDYTKLDKRLVNPEFVEVIRGIYGENSPAWHFKVLGEFPPDDSYLMFSPEKLEKLYDPDIIVPQVPVYLGCDISDGGDCESVFTPRAGNVLLEQRALKNLDSEANADAIELMMEEYHPVRVNIDAIGVGTGTFSVLRRRGHTNVYAVKGNAEPTEPKMYINLRSELYFKASTLVRNEMIKTKFRGERLKSDLQAHYQEPRDDGLFQVITKAKMRKSQKIENSPDYSDSFVYSLYGDKLMLGKTKSPVREAGRLLEINKHLRKLSYNGLGGASGKYRTSRFEFD